MSGLTTQDERLLELAAAGKSAQEMAADTGMPAAKALLRVKQILRERDAWSEVERRQLLMDDLYELKRKVQEQNRDTDWMTDKQITALTKVIETIDVVMEKNGKITESLVDRITEAQSAAMLRLISAAFGYSKKMLMEEFPDLPMEQLSIAFQAGLTEASAAVD